MMFGIVNLKIYLIIAALVATMVGGAYLYFQYSQKQIRTLTTEIAYQQVANASLTLKVNILENGIKESKKDIAALDKKNKAVKRETSRLSKMLSEHNLSYLAAKKPTLIENRVNKASDKVISDLEELTGDSDE